MRGIEFGERCAQPLFAQPESIVRRGIYIRDAGPERGLQRREGHGLGDRPVEIADSGAAEAQPTDLICHPIHYLSP
jgi:hypothetical protein